MPATNFLLSIEGIQFPDFKNDDSKKNFRLLFTILANDEKGDPVTILSALPPLNEDNWTWKPVKDESQNFVPNDGKGKIHIDKLTITERLVFRDVVDVVVVDVKIVDIGDKNALNHLNGTLKKLSGVGLDLLMPGVGGTFAKIFKTLQGDAQKAAEQILNAWSKASDKRLFRGEFARPDLAPLSQGPFKIEGKGVLKDSNDGLGSYSLSFKLSKMG